MDEAVYSRVPPVRNKIKFLHKVFVMEVVETGKYDLVKFLELSTQLCLYMKLNDKTYKQNNCT